MAHDGEDNEPGGRRGTMVAVVAVVLLGAIGWFLAHELTRSARLQDCVMSGRTNCAPIDETR
jgi:hypothetical protein